MKKLGMVYEGKTKKLFETTDPHAYIVEYKDDATAFDGERKGTIEGKGAINNKISNFLMQMLQAHGVQNHFISQLSENETVVKKVHIIPVEVVVRNICAGSLVKRIGLDEGTVLKQPVLELCYKNDELCDPMVNVYHILALDLASDEEIKFMAESALKINNILLEYLKDIEISLVDLKLEFGRDCCGNIMLADEISPDTCRFWDVKTGKKLDKDRFRQNLGHVEDTYKEILNRLTGQ